MAVFTETNQEYFQIKDKYLQGRNKSKFTMEGGKYSKWRPICCGNYQSQMKIYETGKHLAGKMFPFTPTKYFWAFQLPLGIAMEGCAFTI